MTKKKWIAVLALLLCAAALYWRPMSLAEAVAAEDSNIYATTILYRIPNGHIDNLTQSYDLAPGSPEAAALTDILEQYSYHRCLRTYVSDGSMDNKGGSDYTILINTTRENMVVSGTGEILIGPYLYRTDYIGKRNGMALVEDIAALLSTCEPAK